MKNYDNNDYYKLLVAVSRGGYCVEFFCTTCGCMKFKKALKRIGYERVLEEMHDICVDYIFNLEFWMESVNLTSYLLRDMINIIPIHKRPEIVNYVDITVLNLRNVTLISKVKKQEKVFKNLQEKIASLKITNQGKINPEQILRKEMNDSKRKEMLIGFDSLDLDDKLLMIADDSKHSPKYYPIEIEEITPNVIRKLKTDTISCLIQRFESLKKPIWKRFYNNLLAVTEEREVGKSRFSSLGIDGCKGKWVVVYLTESFFEVGKFSTIEEILQRYPDAGSILIDIPIGLPERLEDLRPDNQVRKVLGRKGSSIFNVPCRQAIYTSDKTEAKQVNQSVFGKSLSEQTLGITKYIREVDEFLSIRPQWKNRLLESHPELCFAMLNRGKPVMEKKSSEEGQRIRMEILGNLDDRSDAVVKKFLSDMPSRKKVDDVIDSLCLAITGRLIQERGHALIPEEPMEDSRGILMQMVYAKPVDSNSLV